VAAYGEIPMAAVRGPRRQHSLQAVHELGPEGAAVTLLDVNHEQAQQITLIDNRRTTSPAMTSGSLPSPRARGHRLLGRLAHAPRKRIGPLLT
jgi:hypothetical protein